MGVGYTRPILGLEKDDASSNLPFIEPTMALRDRDLPVGNWVYELKFDGDRALAFKSDKEVLLHHPFTAGNHISFILGSMDMEQIFDARQKMALTDLCVMTGVFVKVGKE